MGIRIHKMLGYGLNDVKYDTKNWKIIDSRFAETGYFGMGCENYTDEGFDEYLNSVIEASTDEFHKLSIVQHGRKEARAKTGQYSYKDSINHCVIHEPEFGLDNVVLFIPPYFGKDWRRYDDIIDYYEPSHHEVDGGIGTGITLLNHSIWPFESYVDCRTMPPKCLNNLHWHLFVDSRNSEKYGVKFAENLLKEMHFESVDEMYSMIRPIIPEELVALLKYLNVFEKEEYIHQLKPMLYWYWA